MKQLAGNDNRQTHRSARIWGLDALKALAICMVVPLHTGLFNIDIIDNPSVQTYLQFAIRIACEGVPIFFFVNGFLLLSDKPFDERKHCRRLKKVIVLLIVWSLILIISQALVTGSPLTLNTVVQWMLETGPGSQFTGVLWFLQTLAALYIITPLIYVALNNNLTVKYSFVVPLFLLAITIAALSYIISFLQAVLPDSWGMAIENARSWVFRLNPYNGIDALVYFVCGGLVRQGLSIKAKDARMGLITYGLLVIWSIALSLLRGKVSGMGILSTVLGVPVIIGWFYLFMNPITEIVGKKPIAKWITSLGSSTLGIYLLHMPIITLVAQIWHPADFLGRLIYTTGITLFCWLITTGMMRNKYLRKIITI
ncbi:acyltransferase [Olsenella sp. KGMB02461]|nr:acyltransferase [Olsenella sp. KGMB02461]